MKKILTQKMRKILKEVYNLPPDEGEVIKLLDDKVFRIFMRRNRKYLAKIIGFVLDIDYQDLIENMILIDNEVPIDNIITHYNSQDIVVSFKNTTINVEMSSNKYRNKRKNEITAHKYAGNQYIEGEKYEEEIYVFYQICLEDYYVFKNDLLINKVNMVNTSSGKYEIETDEFIKFHVNLKNIKKVCYNESNKYLKFLTTTSINELEEISKGDEILMDSLDDLKNLSRDSLLMSELEEQKLDEYCYKLALKDAKEDGEKIGLSKGEKNKQIEIAKNLLKQSVSIEIISKATGLSMEEIENLK